MEPQNQVRARWLALLFLLLLCAACSIKKFAFNKLGDALASGSSVYESDDDLELVGDALPFGLKLMESLLTEVPEHQGLLLTTCKGFTTYTYVYVDQTADVLGEFDLDLERRIRARARRLYLRARAYGLRGLEVSYPGIGARLASDPVSAVAVIKAKDVPLIYWNAAALGLAISVSSNDAEMLAHLPEVQAMLNRALELDEAWQEGALHEFAIVMAGTGMESIQEQLPVLEQHFQRALDLSRGRRASVYVTYAETVAVRTQDAGRFRALLQDALEVDPDQDEAIRLANIVAQNRAAWLLGQVEELFLEPDAALEPGATS